MTSPAFRGDLYFLSNMFPVPVTVYGKTYPCSESAYQAQKLIRREDRIPFQGMDGFTAKRAFRSSALRIRTDWTNINVQEMATVVKAKFTQHPILMEKLRATPDEKLVEYNTFHDNFWGDCTCDKCTNTVGQNRLGNLLKRLKYQHTSAIQYRAHDIFSAPYVPNETIAIAVNCIGVMGAGQALMFKEQYPEAVPEYLELCRSGKLRLGYPQISTASSTPRFLFFPTKHHYKEKSTLHSIVHGLNTLSHQYKAMGITHLRLPMIGCGYGGLPKDQVIVAIEKALGGTDLTLSVWDVNQMIIDKENFTQIIQGLAHSNAFVQKMVAIGMSDELLEAAISFYPYYSAGGADMVDPYIWDYVEYVEEAIDFSYTDNGHPNVTDGNWIANGYTAGNEGVTGTTVIPTGHGAGYVVTPDNGSPLTAPHAEPETTWTPTGKGAGYVANPTKDLELPGSHTDLDTTKPSVDGKPVFDAIYSLLERLPNVIPASAVYQRVVTEYHHINSRLLRVTIEEDEVY